MASLQFTAKNDTGSKWGGEFSGSVKKCVEKQFKNGAAEVTIIDNGKSTLFINSANSKPIIKMDHKLQNEFTFESKAVEPVGDPGIIINGHEAAVNPFGDIKGAKESRDKDREIQLNKYMAQRKAHLCWILPVIGIAANVVFRFIPPPSDPMARMVISYIVMGLTMLFVFGGFWRLIYAIYSLFKLRFYWLLMPISMGLVANVPMFMLLIEFINTLFGVNIWWKIRHILG